MSAAGRWLLLLTSTFVVGFSSFGRRQGITSKLPDAANMKRSVEVVISLCESLQRKTSPKFRKDWKPELYTLFLDELRSLGWSYHVYDHEGCCSQERHAQIRRAVGVHHYSLLPNKGRECGSFFRHMIDRYDSLADTTIFLHGDALSHLAYQLYSLAEMKSCLNFSLPFVHLNSCQAHFTWPKKGNWRAYKNATCFEHLLRFVAQNNPHFQVFPEKIETSYVFSAQFAVHRSRIIQNPTSYYQHLYKMVTDSCECETIRGCDQCIHFEALWWMVLGEPPHNMPPPLGISGCREYDEVRLLPHCRQQVRNGYAPAARLLQHYRRLDHISSASVKPLFLAKLDQRKMCPSFDKDPPGVPPRHLLWAMAVCDALGECAAFSTVVGGGGYLGMDGTTVLFRDVDAGVGADLDGSVKVDVDVDVGMQGQAGRSALALALESAPQQQHRTPIGTPERDFLPVEGLEDGPALYYMPAPGLDSEQVYVSGAGVKFFESHRELTLYIKRSRAPASASSREVSNLTFY